MSSAALRTTITLVFATLGVISSAHASDAQDAPQTTRWGRVFVPVEDAKLGRGFKDDTGIKWFIQRETSGDLVQENANGAANLCQLRGGTLPTSRELERFARYFGVYHTHREFLENYEAPAWFDGLAKHVFWSSTPNHLSRPRGGEAPFDDVEALDGSEGSVFSNDARDPDLNVMCIQL